MCSVVSFWGHSGDGGLCLGGACKSTAAICESDMKCRALLLCMLVCINMHIDRFSCGCVACRFGGTAHMAHLPSRSVCVIT
jgi:hypothetical protein